MLASTVEAARALSRLWRWGFWVCTGTAVAAFVLSLYVPWWAEGTLRSAAGVLLIIGGVHQQRVVRFDSAVRGPYTVFGFHSYLARRQTGWSAIVLGGVLIASAVLGL